MTLVVVTYPYDFCVPANSSRIAAGTLQPSACGCYTNFRIQDKRKTSSLSMVVLAFVG